LFKKIYSLPAGNYIKYDNITKKLDIEEYFHPSDLVNPKYFSSLKRKKADTIKRELTAKIFTAVKRCLISDVSIGTTLSGGIDSSIVTLFAKKINSNIKTFTGVSKGIEKIPEKIVPIITKKLKINKPIIIYHSPKKYLKKLFDIITNSYSPSRWGGGVPMSNICKKARKMNVKVLLSGDGVDELCGGYKTFSTIDLKQKDTYHKIIEINKDTKKNSLIKKYNLSLKLNRLKIKNKLKFISLNNEKKKQLYFLEDISIFLQACTLPHGDEYSMHESLELRNPFLDIDLVEYVVNLLSKYKSKIKSTKNNGKIIFKELAVNYFGKYINNEKEGTRNYALKVSDKEYWNINNFKIIKKFRINKKYINDNRKLFKIINLEFLYQNTILQNKNFSISSILSKKGYKYFYG